MKTITLFPGGKKKPTRINCLLKCFHMYPYTSIKCFWKQCNVQQQTFLHSKKKKSVLVGILKLTLLLPVRFNGFKDPQRKDTPAPRTSHSSLWVSAPFSSETKASSSLNSPFHCIPDWPSFSFRYVNTLLEVSSRCVSVWGAGVRSTVSGDSAYLHHNLMFVW